MIIREAVITELMLFAWREGERLSPGCYEAKLGVAHVIANRVSAGWEDGDWMKILAHVPIHAANNIEEMDWRSYVDFWHPMARKLYQAVGDIYSGALKDSITISADPREAAVNGRPQAGLFWCSLNSITRPWFKDNILAQRSQHPFLASAGTITYLG